MITSHQRRANDRRRPEADLQARLRRDAHVPMSRDGIPDDLVALLEQAGVRFGPRVEADTAYEVSVEVQR